jgi:organic hydroperoxide reductase OsmC/OhrA
MDAPKPEKDRWAHEQICPYSHATRNNAPLEVKVTGA